MKTFCVIIFFVCLGAVLAARLPKVSHLKQSTRHHKGNLKIVGGEEAVPHSIPYQAGILLDGSFCGGSLVSEKWVVTAAHCGKLSRKPEVVLGAHEVFNENEVTQIRLTGSRIIIHEGYDPNTLRNDIALIELPENVTLNENIQIVPLPSSDETYVGKTAKASGWGIIQDGTATPSPTLRFVEAEILDNVICQRQLGAGIAVFDSFICLDGSDRKGICSGDSGGPLVDVDSGVLIGLTSFTNAKGCEKGYPSGFTRISSQVDWIKKIILP